MMVFEYISYLKKILKKGLKKEWKITYRWHYILFLIPTLLLQASDNLDFSNAEWASQFSFFPVVQWVYINPVVPRSNNECISYK